MLTRKGWHRDDLVAALTSLARELDETRPGVDVNLVGKWQRGERVPSRYYGPRLCVVLDQSPEGLGLADRPRLAADIADIRGRVMKHRQEQISTTLSWAATEATPEIHWGRLDGLIPQDEPLRVEDCERIVAQYATQLDTVSPISLMPHVHTLMRQEDRLRKADHGSRLAAAACNTAILAGWLSYNLHNHGDAKVFWKKASDLAEESGSGQLRAYVLGIRSCLYSGVPRRGEAPYDASVAIEQLDEAIKIGKGTSSASLRSWLYARRAEERAVSGHRSGASQDISTAYALLGRHLPAGAANDVPILESWREARIGRYHGSTEQLLGNNVEAIRILRRTLGSLDAAFIPQRAMALTDLAAIYARKEDPEPKLAASLMSQALDIAEQGGVSEASMRVMEARRHLAPWRDEPFVRQLDEQLRVL